MPAAVVEVLLPGLFDNHAGSHSPRTLSETLPVSARRAPGTAPAATSMPHSNHAETQRAEHNHEFSESAGLAQDNTEKQMQIITGGHVAAELSVILSVHDKHAHKNPEMQNLCVS